MLSVQQLEKSVTQKIVAKQFEQALFAVQGFVERVIYNPNSIGKIIASEELDSLCQKIGAGIFAQQQSPIINISSDKELVVYVATRLYNSGGHTAVIEDLIKCQPEKKHVFLITDIFQNSTKEEIAKRFAAYPITFEIAPVNSLHKKVLWLRQRLQALSPGKVFLFNHHQDSVAIAAMQPQQQKFSLYFFHHADHQLCLGVHLPHAIHIDAQALGYHQCRHTVGVKNNIYWPLVVPDLGKRPTEVNFMENKLVTCTSGSPIKFETPYLYSYADLLPNILQATKGKHIHIGKLSIPTLKKIQRNLQQNGINPDNFVHIPWVKSVWQTVIDSRVDLYFNSFPISGGRAIIEIMGSGTPIVMHENYRSEYLGQVYLAYPEVFYWRNPQQLLNFLPTITPSWLKHHAMLARRHYEKFYAPHLLAQAMNCKEGLFPPSVPKYEADVLQAFLEDYQNLDLKYLLKNKMMNLLWSNRRFVNLIRAMRKKLLQI